VGSESKPTIESGVYTVQIGDKTAQFTLKVDGGNSVPISFKTATSPDFAVSGNDLLWSLICFVSGAAAGLPMWYILNNRKQRSTSSGSAFEYGLMSQS
ncbi:hypothetical protein BVRB_042350, partial [Beta vulgaris subsp. vulgaris]